MKIAAIFKNPRLRLTIAIVFVLASLYVQHRIVQLDQGVFPVFSLRSLEGAVFYTLGYYRTAATAYRAHYSKVYKNYGRDPFDEQLSLLLHGDYRQAQSLAESTLKRESLDSRSLLTLSEIALRENRPDDVLTSASIVLKHDPDQFDAQLLSSFALAQKGQYADAIHRVNLALRHGRVHSRITTFLDTLELLGFLHSLPAQQRPWCLLAQYHRYLRIFDSANIDTARALATKAIETGDHPADAYLALGILYSKKWQTEEALQEFLKAIAKDPKHAEALRWAATTYGSRGDVTNEYRYLKAAYEASPGDPFYADRFADVLTDKLGDYYQALSVTMDVLKAGMETSDGYQQLGKIYDLLGNYEDSIRSYGTAIRLNRKNFYAYLGMGASLREAGNTDEAIRVYKSAISLRPTSPRPHIGLAHIYHETARYEEAVTAYERGIQLGERDTAELIALCGMYKQMFRFDKAVECFKKALTEKPNDVTARKNLADAEKNLALSRTLSPPTK